MSVLSWLGALFGGIGLGFVLGFFYGAWCQRRVKAEVVAIEQRREAAKALAEQYEQPEEPSSVGGGHPFGPPPPSYEDSHRKKKNRMADMMRTFGMKQ